MKFRITAILTIGMIAALSATGSTGAQQSSRATLRIGGSAPVPGQQTAPPSARNPGSGSSQARIIGGPGQAMLDRSVNPAAWQQADFVDQGVMPAAGSWLEGPPIVPWQQDEPRTPEDQRRLDEATNPFDPDAASQESIQPVEPPGLNRDPATSPQPPLPGERNGPATPPPMILPPDAMAPGYQPWETICPPGELQPGQTMPTPPLTSNGLPPPGSEPWTSSESAPAFAGSSPTDSQGSFDPAGMPAMWEADGVCGLAQVCSPLFYLDLFAGTHGIDDARGTSAAGLPGSTQLSFERGFSFGTRLGLFQGNNLRTDFEFSLTDNDVEIIRDYADPVAIPGFLVPPTSSGELSVFRGISNAWWDLPVFSIGRVTPYVGAGIGFMSASADWTVFQPSGSQQNLDNDSSAVFQAMVGGTWRCTSRLELFAEYRLVEADEMTLSTESAVILEPAGPRSQLRHDQFDLSGDSVNFGLRMKF
jgi:opacity protein-like surface antigen